MNICIYGASSRDISMAYITPAEQLGEKMARQGHSLVFGGGNAGLMGAAARGVLRGGGKITGVAPSFFNVDGTLFKACSEMIRTDTMRQRKEIMENRSDAFIVMPGGCGTLDEFFEILTLKQLGQHTKPIAIFNIEGYFDDILKQITGAVKKHFMTEESLRLFGVFNNPDKLLDYLTNGSEKLDVNRLKYFG